MQKAKTYPYVLITGGSLGIGLELSKLFAKDNYNLIIVSKPQDELTAGKKILEKKFPAIDIITIQKDLSVQGSAQEIYDEVKAAGIDISILVNNAGFATVGYVNDMPIERELAMINLNMVTVYHLTRLFMNDMVAKDRGQILNIASTAGLVPIPRFCTYAATKAFSHNFSVALNYELKATGSAVRVTTVCPPSVKNTGFAAAADVEDSKLMDSPFTMTPSDVAQSSYKALFKKKSVEIPGFLTKIVVNLVHILPKNIKMKVLMDMI